MQVSTRLLFILLAASLSVSFAVKGKYSSPRNRPRRILKGMKNDKDSDYVLGDGQCEICGPENKERPNRLSVQYLGGTGKVSAFQGEKASCGTQVFPDSDTITVYGIQYTVSDGDIFEFYNPNGKLDADTEFEFASNSNLDCEFHTSCSRPLVAGDQIGPFVILESDSYDCDFGGESVDDDCIICDEENKVRPDSLTVQYIGGPGQISNYQDEDKADCRDQLFPNETIISIPEYGSQFVVKTGDIFTFTSGDEDEMEAETEFFFNTPDGLSCYIHTSCSQPLVVGDRIGPFILLEGNDCSLPVCGDGSVDDGEECDDGNSNNFDDCRNDCTLPFCGDGIVDAGEECDDGRNGDVEDGCLDDCTVCLCRATADYDVKTGIATIDFDMCGIGALSGDWVGIYSCDSETIVVNEEWFQWENALALGTTGNSSGFVQNGVYVAEPPIWSSYTCGNPESSCQHISNRDSVVWPEKGQLKIDPSVDGNVWAFGGLFAETRILPPGCYKVLLNRADEGTISPPPYPVICGPWADAIEFYVPDEFEDGASTPAAATASINGIAGSDSSALGVGGQSGAVESFCRGFVVLLYFVPILLHFI